MPLLLISFIQATIEQSILASRHKEEKKQNIKQSKLGNQYTGIVFS